MHLKEANRTCGRRMKVSDRMKMNHFYFTEIFIINMFKCKINNNELSLNEVKKAIWLISYVYNINTSIS